MSKALNELKKATMASYLSKAGARVRSGTSLGISFQQDADKHMSKALDHSPYNMNGKEKDPEQYKIHAGHEKVNQDLANTFHRDAKNRIKGIARAGRLLAKEETVNELDDKTYANYITAAKKDVKHSKKMKADNDAEASTARTGVQRWSHRVIDRIHTNRMAARKTGIARAGRLLAKEDVLNEGVEQVNEAPLTPEHKAAIKVLKNIPKHYTLKDLQSLAKHTASVARNADFEASSARVDKNNRVRNKNKKRSIEISSRSDNSVTYKNQEGHKLHLKRDGHSYSYNAHLGNRNGPVIDSGSESALRYKHKIGGYNRHFNKAKFDKQFEEAEQIDEISRSTIAKVANARFNQAQAALKQKDYGGYVKKMKKAIKAADATTPNTGWSPEDDNTKKNEEVQISAQEKYRQIKEAKIRARKGK